MTAAPLALLAAAALLCAPAAGHAQTTGAQDLTDLSLEDLLTSEVASVAKRPQTVDTAPAAVFVITKEDIRRSGAQTIPEALRMAPGLEVANLSGDSVAVSVRGFNGRYANKLMVLVDGRAIYLSTISGVLWGQQLAPLEDIERIEIIRGPGASLWGANAVNGVINIITRHAVDSLGARASVTADTLGQTTTDLQFGAPLGQGAVRLYLTARDLGEGDSRARAAQGGFRYDQDVFRNAALTVQGDLQSGRWNEINTSDALREDYGRFKGGNLLARLAADDGDKGFALQAYWDHVDRRELISFKRDQFDLDFSRHQRLGGVHQLVWGGDARLTHDEVEDGPVVRIRPRERTDRWFGAFVQDEVALLDDRLRVTLGVKVEHNQYTGVEVQPTARAWLRVPGGSVWTSVSRATRTPSRLEADGGPTPPDGFVESDASRPTLDAETLDAYELGWRGMLPGGVRFDLAAFHNRYDGLVVWRDLVGAGDQASAPFNAGRAVDTGLEAALEAKPAARWTLKAAASWQRLRNRDGLRDGVRIYDLAASPDYQLSLRSWYDLSDDLELDAWLRRVGPFADGATPGYDDLDVQLSWRAGDHLQLQLFGRNLLEPRRIEMNGSLFGATGAPVARTVGVKLAWRR
ncbi:TonB-dependent receptor plug domain-containing protein [Caulobacter hibisci]|uniref:TonB-dependent receptor n=1 Tax=Caulobacter hibisci TaxID=2035993 RepID=A0ABS0T6E8_9CAUL|nr:TonB-dependent receptor [Caulobacter hibisci]MBI1686437.1 TonB-dependent receptor [Caulobacter hibisci]